MFFEKLFGSRAKDVTPPPSLDAEGKKAVPEAMEGLPVEAKAEIDKQFNAIDVQLNKDTFWTKMRNIVNYVNVGAGAALVGAASWAALIGGLPLLTGGAFAAYGALAMGSGVIWKKDTDRRLREATASSFYRKESILRRFLKKIF